MIFPAQYHHTSQILSFMQAYRSNTIAHTDGQIRFAAQCDNILNHDPDKIASFNA